MKNTSKKGLLMSILWALVLITTVVSSVVVAQSAKAAKLYLRHNVTYTAPTCIQVTFDAGDGIFSDSQHTYDTTIKISTLSDTSIFPADPTLSGYTFAGWEYSTTANGTYSDYLSSDNMPFTDHLYVRAKWEEVTGYEVTITFEDGESTGAWQYTHIYDDWYGDWSPAGKQIGYIDSADGSTEVCTTTGKVYICAIGSFTVIPGVIYVSGGVEDTDSNPETLCFNVSGDGSIVLSGWDWSD